MGRDLRLCLSFKQNHHICNNLNFSIRLTVNTELTEEEIRSSIKLIEEVVHQYTSPAQDVSEES